MIRNITYGQLVMKRLNRVSLDNVALEGVSLRRNPLSKSTLWLTSAIAAISLAFVAPGVSSSVRAAWKDSPKAVVDQAWQIVYREYVDPTFNKNDWLAVRRELLSKDYSSKTEAYTALRQALAKLEDPYSRFMDPDQYRALTDQTSGELSGVGMRLRADEKTKIISVLEPLRNSPAIQAGVKAGDQILMIDNRSAKGMTVEEAASLIRGEVGSKVKIKFARDNKPFELTITRARVEVPSVESSVKQEEGQRVGYIRLNQFTTHSQEEMQLTVKSLVGKGVDSFVLDLRGNPGGSLKACIDISRMWINEGPIVKTVDRDNANEVYEANRSALTDLPLVVLVDKGSASSSEIFSGAVKDNKRALLVGTETFGKALVQSLHSLSDGSGIAVTIAHYYTPDGTDISKKGIKPDIEIELTEEQQKFLASNQDAIATVQSDPQYAKAVQLLRERFGVLSRPARNNSASAASQWR